MYKKNTASQFITFQGVDASTGGIKSGVTWTIRRCIDGTFAAGGGTCTEDGTTGFYKCALSQADTNGNNIGFNFTGTGAVPQTVNIVTDGNPPSVDVAKLLGTAWLTPGTAGTPDVNVKLWNALTTVALPLVPTVAGRTLDCSAGGEAGVDWANVGSPTTTVGLSGTTVGVLTTYTGNTLQTADVATLITTVGAAGAGLTAVGLATTSRAGIRKNTALAKFEFLMTDSTNHNPATGLTVAVTRSVDGGAFGAGTLSAVTEVANGIYYVDFAAGDLNGNVITLRATAASSDDVFVTIKTSP